MNRVYYRRPNAVKGLKIVAAVLGVGFTTRVAFLLWLSRSEEEARKQSTMRILQTMEDDRKRLDPEINWDRVWRAVALEEARIAAEEASAARPLYR